MTTKTFNIRIEGTTPLLLNKFTDEEAMSASSGTRLSTAKHRGHPRDVAETKLYKDIDGNNVIPQPNLLRCIIDAGKYFKSGKSKVTTQKSSLVPACVDIEGVDIPLQSEKGWQTDTRPVRIPSTGGRILAHRPCFPDWALEFVLNLDTDVIAPPLLREIIDVAGKRIGLGDFRPDCKGPYGKFVVTQWKELSVV